MTPEETVMSWTCPQCSTDVEEEFDACWNCMSPRLSKTIEPQADPQPTPSVAGDAIPIPLTGIPALATRRHASAPLRMPSIVFSNSPGGGLTTFGTCMSLWGLQLIPLALLVIVALVVFVFATAALPGLRGLQLLTPEYWSSARQAFRSEGSLLQFFLD